MLERLKRFLRLKRKRKKFVPVHGGGFGDTPLARAAARKLEEALNGPVSLNVARPKIEPLGICYIFNCGPIEFCIQKGSAGTYRIPACAEGKRYAVGPVIPAIHQEFYRIEDEFRIHETTGVALAEDIVTPITQGWSANTDLTKWGVFWTFNEIPTEAEILRAEAEVKAQSRLKDLRTTKMLRDDLEKLGWKLFPPSR